MKIVKETTQRYIVKLIMKLHSSLHFSMGMAIDNFFFFYLLNYENMITHDRRLGKYRTRLHIHAKSLQSYLTLCEPMDYSLPDSSVQGILQARVLEWVAKPLFRGSSQPRDGTCFSQVSCIRKQVLYH